MLNVLIAFICVLMTLPASFIDGGIWWLATGITIPTLIIALFNRFKD